MHVAPARIGDENLLVTHFTSSRNLFIVGSKKYPRWKVDNKRTEMFLHCEKA